MLVFPTCFSTYILRREIHDLNTLPYFLGLVLVLTIIFLFNRRAIDHAQKLLVSGELRCAHLYPNAHPLLGAFLRSYHDPMTLCDIEHTTNVTPDSPCLSTNTCTRHPPRKGFVQLVLSDNFLTRRTFFTILVRKNAQRTEIVPRIYLNPAGHYHIEILRRY